MTESVEEHHESLLVGRSVSLVTLYVLDRGYLVVNKGFMKRILRLIRIRDSRVGPSNGCVLHGRACSTKPGGKMTSEDEIYRSLSRMRRGDQMVFKAREQLDVRTLLALSVRVAVRRGKIISFCLTGEDLRLHCSGSICTIK